MVWVEVRQWGDGDSALSKRSNAREMNKFTERSNRKSSISDVLTIGASMILVVEFMPEMKGMPPLFTFLRLRAVCRCMVWPGIRCMMRRLNYLIYLGRARLKIGFPLESESVESWDSEKVSFLKETHEGRMFYNLTKILASGVLRQMWAPTSPSPAERSFYRTRLEGLTGHNAGSHNGVLFDVRTGRPLGMTAGYWGYLQKRTQEAGFGWIDGVLHF